jgi:DNA-binding NarL/FixJ family response regulator
MHVFIVDERRIVRDGLRELLSRRGIQVVGDVATVHDEAIAVAKRLRPTVAIIGGTTRALNGVDATRRLIAALGFIKVLAVSANDDRDQLLAMLAAGASGYVAQEASTDELVRALHAVHRGERYRSPTFEVSRCGRELTARERDVLRLVARGMGSKEIAHALSIAVPTVETHRRQIMDKVGRRTIAGLTKYAIRAGLASVDD